MKAQRVNLGSLLELVLYNIHLPSYIWEKNEETGMWNKCICLRFDKYYIEHKEELWEREVYFISVEDDEVNIYLRKEIVK